MTVLAHAGHWLTSRIYLVPVAAIVAALFIQRLRDRAAAGRERAKVQRPG